MTSLDRKRRAAKRYLKRRGLLRAQHSAAKHTAMLIALGVPVKKLRGGDATESGSRAEVHVAEPPASGTAQEARRLRKVK